jgi:hypothetical protein
MIKYSPGVAKVWVHWEMEGAHGILDSYGMGTVTDGNSAGKADHLWGTDFSGDDYVIIVGGHNDSWGDVVQTTKVAGGATTANWIHVIGANPARGDNESNLVAFGDQ